MMHGRPCPCAGQTRVPLDAGVLAKGLIAYDNLKLDPNASASNPKLGP